MGKAQMAAELSLDNTHHCHPLLLVVPFPHFFFHYFSLTVSVLESLQVGGHMAGGGCDVRFLIVVFLFQV